MGDLPLWKSYAKLPFLRSRCCINPYTVVQIPLPFKVVGQIERAMHSSSIATSGSQFRAHGSFIALLATMECDERYKQALCCYAPVAMKAFMDKHRGVSRMERKGRQEKQPDCHLADQETTPTDNKSLVNTDHTAALQAMPPNGDCADGKMPGTRLNGNEFGEEDRVYGEVIEGEAKILAHQIGPDLIPTECFDNTAKNMKAGLAKRVKPLPFNADKRTIRKIEKTVSAIIGTVFSPEKIRQWRIDNPVVEEFASSKWSGQRFREAFEEAMSESRVKIEQTLQIKVNEALPAQGKAPRPIIQCGDKAQVMMSLPVKCFEDLLFEHFEDASIKHATKYDAMERVAERLKQKDAHLIEGDGSAWDSCCNPTIRKLTENRIIEYIIEILGEDPEIPKSWMKTVLADMQKPKIKGKVKTSDHTISPLKACIEAIRQSGHRGTSCFNYLINLVCWLVVVCAHPERMIRKGADHKLPSKYISPRDGKEYRLSYAFEGDDSALSTTENLEEHQESIEKLWTNLGFRMKLVYVKEKMTFTGFDFLCDDFGPTGVFIPEIPRNIASSSWTTSPLVKMDPRKASEVGMAAMLARAENFKDCGPFSAYFAALGLAHAELAGDREINSAEAKSLAINVSPSVKRSLQELMDSAGAMTPDMRRLVNMVIRLSPEEEAALLYSDFGKNPLDLEKARKLIPFSVWDPAKFQAPRR